MAADDTLNPQALWAAHLEGEPLTSEEVQAVVAAGITTEDEWEDRGGGLHWHMPTWPALED